MSAIAFPRAMPDELPVAGLTFQLDPMIELTPTRGGKIVSADLGPTTWKARFESGQMDETEFGVCRAWADTMMNSQVFLGYDKLRQYPLAYPSGWGSLTVGMSPFDGTAKIDDVTNGKLVDLKSLPVGFILSRGDYFASNYGSNGARALYRIAAGGTADSSGNLTVEVRPLVQVGWAEDDVVEFYRPSALMCMVPGSYSERITPPSFGYITFDAVQVKP